MDSRTVARRSTRAFDHDEMEVQLEKSSKVAVPSNERSSEQEARQAEMQMHSRKSSRHSSIESQDMILSDLEGNTGIVTEKARKHSSDSLELDREVKEKTNGVPLNFGTIMPGVYRSAYPQADDHPYLKQLGLRTILTLVEKDYPEGYQEFMSGNGIHHIVIDMAGTKKTAIPLPIMQAVLEVVLDETNYPMLVHCNQGKHRTGCVAAVIRKLSGWDTATAVDEYRSFSAPKARDVDIDYISAFEISSVPHLLRDIHARQAIHTRSIPSGGESKSFGHVSPTSRLPRTLRFCVFAVIVMCVWTLTCSHWSPRAA